MNLKLLLANNVPVQTAPTGGSLSASLFSPTPQFHTRIVHSLMVRGLSGEVGDVGLNPLIQRIELKKQDLLELG